MTIKYADGRSREAALISRTNNTMRVVLKGTEDVTSFTEVSGAWFSEHWELVQPEFAWQSRSYTSAPLVSDCVCSAELAATLIDLLFAPFRQESLTA